MSRGAILVALAALAIFSTSGCKCFLKSFPERFADAKIVGTFKVISAKIPQGPNSCNEIDGFADHQLRLVELYKGDCSVKAGASLPTKIMWTGKGKRNGVESSCGLSCGGPLLNVGQTYLLSMYNFGKGFYGAGGCQGNRAIFKPINKITAAEKTHIAAKNQC